MKNVPNILTVIRIIMVPIFVVLFFSTSTTIAAVVFALACLTDVADGYIARKFNAISDLGKVLDPFADKFIKLTALCCLVIKNLIPAWIFFTMLVFDAVFIFAGALLYKKKLVISSNIVGKAGALCVTVAIFISFFKFQGINEIIFYISIGIIILSTFIYGSECINKLKTSTTTSNTAIKIKD
ncbi:MAG: CDP-alcohol phosphatidyltransferase family protein [Clostridia bacterium]|jgi:CDP-diacylglycerol--glycerol-3-phosphate 3-phosphatidyltransferase|nr:CDP-alcohol phosphatidyltransferase family protein [Clostridia bacterium]MDD4275509.1 CDP-alcohol phosphatidyltransferase family protein [Clostridia bacterium]